VQQVDVALPGTTLVSSQGVIVQLLTFILLLKLETITAPLNKPLAINPDHHPGEASVHLAAVIQQVMGDVALAYGHSLGWSIDHHGRGEGYFICYCCYLTHVMTGHGDGLDGVRSGAHLEVKVNLSFDDSQAEGKMWWDPLVDGNMERVEIPLEYQTLLLILGD
jgi:hypothetical protein